MLSAIAALYWITHSMMRPLVAPFALTLGLDPSAASLVVGAYAFLPFLLAIPTGSLADALGKGRLLQAGAVGMVASGALLVASDGIWLLMLAQVFAGLSSLAVWLAVQALVTLSEGESDDDRNRRLANFSFFVSGGQLAGPLLGGVIADVAGYRSSFFVYLVLSALLALLVGLTKRPSHKPKREKAPLREPLLGSYRVAFGLLGRRGVLLTVIVSFTALALIDLRISFYPIYLGDLGFSPSLIGALISTGGVFALFARPLLPSLLRRFGAGGVVALCLVPGALASGAAVLTESVVLLFVLVAVAGLALGVSQPLTLALTADYTEQETRGVGVGLRIMANRSALWVNPLLFGLLLTLVGMRPAFVCIALLMVTLSALVALALGRVEKERPKRPR